LRERRAIRFNLVTKIAVYESKRQDQYSSQTITIVGIGSENAAHGDQAATEQISYLDFPEKLLKIEIKHHHH